MNTTRYGLLATITVFSACGTLLSPIVAQGQEEVSNETEVLTRGPVHEAFAETVSFEPEAGILISTQPPEPIDELPPEQELEGDNVTWIAGYWAWDEDLNDFVWISGVWRNVPPDREWVPGYWNDVGSQYQWVSGYWAEAGVEEVAYLPEPPKTLERGPNIAAPSDDDVWVPGSWIYVSTASDYRWRPGYWQPYRRNWAYVPDRYCWTPRGYVFVAGYWDYPVVNRGIIFAPVRFHRPVWREPSFHYSPVTVINVNVVVNHLFVRPRYGHYYFGDYYEPRYRDRGFYSSVSYATARTRGFDPIFSYQRWEHRHDRNWERNRMNDYEFFRDNRDARPPQTWAALKDVGDGRRGFRNREGKEMAIATPLPVFAKRAEAGDTDGPKQRFKELNQASREKIVDQRQKLKNFTQQRKQIEKEAPAPVAKAEEGQPAPAVKPSRAKFQRSPVVGRKVAQLAPDQAPPKRKAAPAVAEKDPTPDDQAAKPDDNQPDQPRRPGRGQGGRGQGKGEAQDDTAKPDTTTPDRMPEKADDVAPGREPKVKPQPQPEREPRVRPQPQPKKEESTEREPKEKPDPQPKPEREPKVKPTPQPQPEREPKVKPTPQPQPEREPKVRPQPQPKPERAQPQPQPKREQAQPQPQPKRERAQPQPQPKRERVQPQPKKEEVQPQVKRPQAQPQQQPRERAQPQPKPRREQAQPQRERAQPQQPQGGGVKGRGGKEKEKEKE